MNFYISLSFDCDNPRGIEFVNTEIGRKKLENTIRGLNFIKNQCDKFNIPRTYFICGSFLKTLLYFLNQKEVLNHFSQESMLVEIGNHSWSHSVIKNVVSRPEKKPLTLDELSQEIERTNNLLKSVFSLDEIFGFRSPLGHENGIQNDMLLQDLFKQKRFKYVSTKLRGVNDSILAPLINEEGVLVQPFFYQNELLEIPAQGWHDTAFSKTSNTPLFWNPPNGYEEIISYFNLLISQASDISKRLNKRIFLSLLLHPSEILFYAKESFFEDILFLVNENAATLIRQIDIYENSREP